MTCDQFTEMVYAMSDEFSPNGNPQDRFQTIDPMKYLPAGFVPVMCDPVSAQATVDAIEADMSSAALNGQMNQVLDIGLGVIRALLGVPKV